jgi:hypothetical protein
LPAFALALGCAARFLLTMVYAFNRRREAAAAWVLAALIALDAWQVLRERPLVYVEGTKNIAARRLYEEEIPPVLRALLAERPGGVILMNTSVYPELVALTGIPLRRTINESDKEFYAAALAAPASHAALVLSFAGDEIDQAVKAHPQGLELVRRFTDPGQPPAALYVSDTPASTSAPAR